MNGTQKTLARFGLASAALIAAISAPVTLACAAIGGAASYKLGKSYGQKKYGGRDIGGVMPIALICLGSGLGGAAIAGYTGAKLSEEFAGSANAETAFVRPAPAKLAQAGQDLQKSLSKHFVHNFAVK